MQFLYDGEVEAWCAERGLSWTDERDLRTVLYYDGPPHRHRVYFNPQQPERAPALAAALISALGAWDDAILWVTRWGVWPSSEDWPAYYAARGARGERRSIDDTPGHRFAAAEREALTEFATLVLQNGWDAFVLASSGAGLNPIRLQLSHDEWAEVQATTPVTLDVAAG